MIRALTLITFLTVASLGFSTPSRATPYAGQTQMAATKLVELSLEELSQITISSVSKRDESAFDAPAALYVITAEQIRSSGVTSIPDALRLAPGVHVARIDANKWAISIRGFSDRFANKLLVLQDGQSIYSPFFGGVWWNIQDIMLEDIERIEVIRGSGATLWGSNAVNGVINIITKSARDTVGGLINAGGGTFEKGFGAFRYGAKVGTDSYIRGYAQYFSRNRQTTADGQDRSGGWDNWSGGMRMDWAPTTGTSLILTGNHTSSRSGDTYFDNSSLMGRLKRDFSQTSSATLQIAYNHFELNPTQEPELRSSEGRDTFDLDLQHSFQPHRMHEVLWGIGYRFYNSRSNVTPSLRMQPSNQSNHLPSLFVQDEITLVPERLKLTLGLRLEHSEYTGYELQPTGRLLWTPNRSNTFWAAVTRAVRNPAQVQDNIEATVATLPPGSLGPGSPEARVRVLGSTSLKAESVLSGEAGYRTQLTPELLLDLALFYTDYQRLVGIAEAAPYMASGYLVLPYQAVNNAKGQTWGTELALTWRPLDMVSLTATYSWLEMRMHSDEPPAFRYKISQIGTSPEQQFGLRSGFKLPGNLQLGLWLRYVDRLQRDSVGSYTELDASIIWNPVRQLELALVGKNLLNKYHDEFSSDLFGFPSTRSERGMYGKLTWKF